MNKKILAFILAIGAPVLSLYAREVEKTFISADDDRITYVGRTLAQDGKVSFDWTGVQARFRFTGSCLNMTASDSRRNYFDVWIDKSTGETPDKVISTHGSDSTIVLCDAADLARIYGKAASKVKEHTVIIKKRTEGEQGKVTISGYEISGNLLQAEGLKSRQIEVVGDSYTCGFGTESLSGTDPFLAETENNNLTYESVLARYFDADYYAVAHSGMGIARNYGGHKAIHMPERYLYTFDEEHGEEKPLWKASEHDFKPALTIIYLGTNDFSEGERPLSWAFKRQYIQLIREIKENYGEEHPVLCVSSKVDYDIERLVYEIARESGLQSVYYAAVTEGIYNNDSELGAAGHPNYKGQIKLAHLLIPYVSTITGWPLTGNPIK